jgi:hypothetical protein
MFLPPIEPRTGGMHECPCFSAIRLFYLLVGTPASKLNQTNMKTNLRLVLSSFTLLLTGFYLVGCASDQLQGYQGRPFHDSVYQGGPQKIPGRVQCAYYDLGGEGIAYHDSDAVNHGSGGLNPADGSYLNEFRMKEGVDTSYTKFHDAIDNNPYDLVQPLEGQLYVGWTEPGEWFNMTVDVQQAGVYSFDLLYTSNRGGTISLDRNGKPLVSSINVISTRNDQDPIAWRQWHHWNIMTNLAEVDLPRGLSILTLHVVTEGNMNLAYLDFKLKN